MGESTISKWMLNAPQQFNWACWEDEENVVLFHEGSGDTILLNPLGEFLLKTIGDESAISADLAVLACKYFELTDAEELNQVIQQTLDSFRKMGLVISDGA